MRRKNATWVKDSISSMHDRVLVDRIAGEMAAAWKTRRGPPVGSVADLFVYGITFMNVKRLPKFFNEVLGGSELTDLGAGNPDAMVEFALACDVRRYAAVDLHYNYAKTSYPDPRVVLKNEDMLRYLYARADESSNIFLGGIDDLVLMNIQSSDVERRYRDMLLDQIARVVPRDGIVFGVNTQLLEELAGYGFRRLPAVGRYKLHGLTDVGVFQKS